MDNRVYCCIDLKSFFASVECVERGLDPFKVNLVVADPDRSKGTICLAVSPAMKELGVKNRCRIFEIPRNIDYIVAKPRMKAYVEKSAEIYGIYLDYISPEDIHVYSIDECFIDLTDYVKIYDKDPVSLAKTLTNEVYKRTGIRATVGIGTNLFLAKVALDITAKHAKDFIGILNLEEFKKNIWHHRPITDVWNIGKGIAKRLERFGVYDLYGITRLDEKILYKEFGINAELIIDHAYGIEPCTIKDIQNYKTKNCSLSNGQILFCDYNYIDAFTIVKEMVDGLVLELVEKDLVANGIFLSVGYSDKNCGFTGGSLKMDKYTNSYKHVIKYFEDYYFSTVKKNVPIRRINVGLNNVVYEDFSVVDFFTDIEGEKKEKDLQKTLIDIKRKYGKNAILKATSYTKEATARERNKMIGGHKSGEDE